MLYILLSSFAILPAIFGFGSYFRNKLKLWSGTTSDFFIGLIIIGIAWTILAFFIPLNHYVELVSLFIGWVGFIKNRCYIEIFKIIKERPLLFTATTSTILFFGSFYPFILDHFGYYVPQIKWVTEYGLIKGISNLELIQGQMSIWHIIQAGFSHYTDPFLRLNTIFLIGFLLYIIEKKSDLLLIFFPILYLFIQSPSPDLIVICLSLIVLNEVLRENKNSAALFLLSVYIFIIKPTMIWPPLLVFLYNLIILKKYKNLNWIFPGLLLSTLYILKNMWTFGYPIFPLQIFDFNVSWKPHSYILDFSAKTAVEKTYDNQYTLQQISDFTSFDYIYNWIFLKGIKSYIHISFAISLIGFCIYTLFSKKRLILLICISLLVKSILVLLFSAQYRFFIDVFFVIALIVLYQRINLTKIKSVFIFGTLLVGLFLSYPKILQQFISSFKLGYMMAGFSPSQIIKPSEYKYSKYTSHQIGNLKFNLVKDYPFSFETPIPALNPEFLLHYSNAKIFPQTIDGNIKNGFVWKKTTQEEQEYLKKIIENWKQSYDKRKK